MSSQPGLSDHRRMHCRLGSMQRTFPFCRRLIGIAVIRAQLTYHHLLSSVPLVNHILATIARFPLPLHLAVAQDTPSMPTRQ